MQLKGKRITALCCALALTLMATGCGSKEETEDASGKTAEVVADVETESDAAVQKDAEMQEQLEVDLYNTYIEINNQMGGRFYDVLDSYFEYVMFQEEFETLEEDYWCLSNVSTFYDAMEHANELLSQKTEKDALDEAYIALYPVMKELATTVDAVEQYTDMKSYVDDDYAKGKEYHAIIWEYFSQYESLCYAFYEQLAIVAEQSQQEDMKRLKEEGFVATYSILKMFTTAQEIQGAIYEQGIDDYNVLELDTEALQPLYDQYVEEVQTCLGYLADESIMQQEGFPVKSAYFSTFDDAVMESKVALTDLFQRVEKQEPVDEFYLDSYFADEGTVAKFDETVSEMIDDYNMMINY